MENKESKKENTSVGTFRPKSYMLGYINLDTLTPSTLGQPTKDLQDVFSAANRLVGPNDLQSLKEDNLGLAMYQGSSKDDCDLIHFLFDSGWEACDLDTLKTRLAGGDAPDMAHVPTRTTNPVKATTDLRIKNEDNTSAFDFKQDVIAYVQYLKFVLSLDCPADMVDYILPDIEYVKKQEWFTDIVGKNKWANTAAFDIVRNLIKNSHRAQDYPFAATLELLRSNMETGLAENITGHYTDKEKNQVVLSMLLHYLSIEGESDKIKATFGIGEKVITRIHTHLIQQAVVNANVFILRAIETPANHKDDPEKVEKSLKSLPQDSQVSFYRAGINTAMDNIEISMRDFNWRVIALNPDQKKKVVQNFSTLTDDAKVNFILGHVDTIDFAIDPVFNDLLLGNPKDTSTKMAGAADKRPKP